MTTDANASDPLSSYLGLDSFGLGYDNATDAAAVSGAANDSLASASTTVGVAPAPSASSPVAFVTSLRDLNVPYAACEALVAVMAVAGNALVILAFQRERRLRRRTNYYIVSLAMADLLVGLLGIPFALLASVGLPHNLYACLFTVSLLVVLCTISIFCLVAVSVDRYWAILHPLGYSRNVSTKKAVGIIGVCWLAGTLVGFLPLLGWHRPGAEGQQCYFTRVMDYNYLVFLYFFTIIFPALILAAFYAHIYQVVLKQLRRMERQSPGGGIRGGAVCGVGAAGGGGGGTMLRVLGAARKREVKATQNLSIIVLFFVLCWFPLYTINCVQAFCPQCVVPPAILDCCIILSHLNSAGNPLLYAYHLKDFRAALRALLLGPGLGPDAALDFGNTGVTAVSAASRTPLAVQRNNVVLCTPSASPVPGLMVPLSTISRTCAGSLWSLQPRYTPAPPLTPSRSASDLGSRSATPSGSESGTETAAATEKDGHLAAPGPHQPRGRAWRNPRPRDSPAPAPATPLSPRSPKPRLSPLRAVGEFFTGCSWKDDANGKAGKASSASTEPLDMDTTRS